MELHISPLVSITLHVRDTCIYIVNRYAIYDEVCIYIYVYIVVISPPKFAISFHVFFFIRGLLNIGHISIRGDADTMKRKQLSESFYSGR